MSLLALLVCIFSASAYLWGALVLFVALHVFFTSLGITLSYAEFLLIGALVLAAPFSAWLAGRFLDRFSFPGLHVACFSALGLSLAFALLIDSSLLFDYLRAALNVLAQDSWSKKLLLFTALGNSVLFCAGLVAFVLTLLVLAVELPVVWFGRLDRTGVAAGMAALRPLLLLMALCLAFNHIVGLFADELSPTMLIRKVWGG